MYYYSSIVFSSYECLKLSTSRDLRGRGDKTLRRMMIRLFFLWQISPYTPNHTKLKDGFAVEIDKSVINSFGLASVNQSHRLFRSPMKYHMFLIPRQYLLGNLDQKYPYPDAN